MQTQCSGTNVEKGYWQEQIIWNAISDIYEKCLGEAEVVTKVSVDIRQRATWTRDKCEVKLDWFKPNKHPKIVGKRKPDFSISVNGEVVVAIESKNHRLGYKPWNSWGFSKHVLTRFQTYNKDLRKILVIGELRIRKSHSTKVARLLIDQHIEVVETGRQATSGTDSVAYNVIKSKLELKLLPIMPKTTTEAKNSELATADYTKKEVI